MFFSIVHKKYQLQPLLLIISVCLIVLLLLSEISNNVQRELSIQWHVKDTRVQLIKLSSYLYTLEVPVHFWNHSLITTDNFLSCISLCSKFTNSDCRLKFGCNSYALFFLQLLGCNAPSQKTFGLK